MVNGLGPSFFPANWRAWLTRNVWFMARSSWVEHDKGYARGSPPRLICDLTFYAMMVRDSYRQTGWRRFAALVISWGFFRAVRVFGWISWRAARASGDVQVSGNTK